MFTTLPVAGPSLAGWPDDGVSPVPEPDDAVPLPLDGVVTPDSGTDDEDELEPVVDPPLMLPAEETFPLALPVTLPIGEEVESAPEDSAEEDPPVRVAPPVSALPPVGFAIVAWVVLMPRAAFSARTLL
jgi:hypothetical protein